VYVLDVAKRACAAILYTGHAPGSLRGLPLVWNEPDTSGAGAKRVGWLLVNLAFGQESVTLRAYELPIRQPDQKPIDLPIKLPGDVWTAPWHDRQKLAVATDAGVLGLFGIREKGNRDKLLFRLLQSDFRLEDADSSHRARALVVHADQENYWVLSGGRLHRLQRTFTAQSGPALVRRWPQPVKVGSPLHAGQVHQRADGSIVLILAALAADESTCWLRAIDAEHGQVLWQRQLGFVSQDQLAAAGAVLADDAHGTFLFEANRFFTDKRWQPGGALLDARDKESSHWTFTRGSGFVRLAWNAGSGVRITLIGGSDAGMSKTYPLPAPLQGTPALASDHILLPLANGITMRVPLPTEEGGPISGPEWRGAGVDEGQQGHIVGLGNNDFAVTDGGRTVTRLHWGEAKVWEKLGEAEMAHRITAAPVAVGDRIFVADASDTITMLEGERLAPGRRWLPGGKITAGPFLCAHGVGLVVGRNRLLWLDPAQDQPVWEYTFVAPIVGQPELVEGLLVVADLQGNIVALDPASGNPAGPGYRLKANVAPSAAPVPFGEGNVFLPLMDGTAMVLPLDKLRSR
jgi:hypothetical protein